MSKVIQLSTGISRKSNINIHLFSMRNEYQRAVRQLEAQEWVIEFTTNQKEDEEQTLFDIYDNNKLIKEQLNETQLIELANKLNRLKVYW